VRSTLPRPSRSATVTSSKGGDVRERITPFRIAYELGLLLAAVIILLVPIHLGLTRYLPVDRILPQDRFAATGVAPWGVAPGDAVPVYRFSPDWTGPIGEARLDEASGTSLVFSYDPSQFLYAVGRQGRVVSSSPAGITVDIGRNLRLVPGDHLLVFRGMDAVARIRLTDVMETSSAGVVESGQTAIAPGALVGEFTVPTQVTVCNAGLLSTIDVALVLAVLGLFTFCWIVLRKSPFAWIGLAVRRLVRLGDRTSVRIAWNLAVGVVFVWVSARFLISLVAVLVDRLAPYFVPQYQHDAAGMADRLGILLPTLGVLGGLAYLYVLFRDKRSPILILWDKLGFRGGPLKIMPRSSARDAATWILHLVIAYAFAYSLAAFIQGNTNDALRTAWPESTLKPQGAFDVHDLRGTLLFFQSTFAMWLYMPTHAPHFSSVQSVFVTVRDFVYNLTILGCLIGYVHSITGYIWGKRIRNLDFTIPGWITNAFCYGPLLGLVMALLATQMQHDVLALSQPGTPPSWLPPEMGSVPVYVSGVMPILVLSVELVLNVLYTLTIFNLGTMFGVMTDKGVRRTGFYGVVRHPSYTMEALMFVAFYLKGLSSPNQWLAVLVIFILAYWLRSEREDDFMTHSNPEFDAYRGKVRYKFIPEVY